MTHDACKFRGNHIIPDNIRVILYQKQNKEIK